MTRLTVGHIWAVTVAQTVQCVGFHGRCVKMSFVFISLVKPNKLFSWITLVKRIESEWEGLAETMPDVSLYNSKSLFINGFLQGYKFDRKYLKLALFILNNEMNKHWELFYSPKMMLRFLKAAHSEY